MPEKREFKPRRRRTNLRDASLIVIATEGDTERKYFSDLISPSHYRNPRVHVEVLSRNTTDSSPENVLRELVRFKSQYRLRAGDELWMVIDYDRWGEKKLSTIGQLCHQKGFFLAVSRPCFELWILCHLQSLLEIAAEEKGNFLRNNKVGSRSYLELEILKHLNEYNKANPKCEMFLDNVELAIERARALDQGNNDRWPQDLGTHVHLLVSKIILT